MEPTAIGLVSLNSNSETHMTAICDARLIYGRGWEITGGMDFTGIYMLFLGVSSNIYPCLRISS